LRRWSIAVIMLVIFVVAVTVGIVVASWPDCCRL
jgi:hypothetical protein